MPGKAGEREPLVIADEVLESRQSSGVITAGYSVRDTDRPLPEKHSSRRSDFARDRARILHSSAFRRLAAKTQVLSPADLDFARNRLTHSLEVAQVGRELATSLGLDPDVVDTACLAHDLGHPPYGHNGERALAEWAEDIGGFEGNAQSLRILTRLEPKVVDAEGTSLGLNLTRASLDASCKYPWAIENSVGDPGGRAKYGVYPDDRAVFDWLREGSLAGVKCIEAQVMDLSDDIAYSVHDFEDAILTGYVDVAALGARVDHEDLVGAMHSWVGGEFSHDELIAAFDELDSLDIWLEGWNGSRLDQARLKNLTSQLIGRFAARSVAATREAYPQASLARFGGSVVIPRQVQAEIAVLKGIVAAFVMASDSRQPIYVEQRELITSLADELLVLGEGALEVALAADFRAAPDDAARKRVIVDQVASLTDQSAIAWSRGLLG